VFAPDAQSACMFFLRRMIVQGHYAEKKKQAFIHRFENNTPKANLPGQ
jgi:hypothetical protein